MKKFTAKGTLTRMRILNSATRIFAEKGFAGSSVDEIIEDASVNKRMVYHYFGNKKKLYQEVMENEYSKLGAMAIQVHPEDPIETVIDELVSAYFSFFITNPYFVRIFLWENLSEGKHMDQMEHKLRRSPVLDLVKEIVASGKRRGTIRSTIDPRFFLISLVGNCTIYYSNKFTLSRTLGIDLSDPKVLDRAKRAVTDLMLHGVLA